jgi:RimJ/RimL family protein N-acetyltransferase
MKYILKTKRLYFRTFLESDAHIIYVLNLNPEVIQYTGDQAFINELEALTFIKNYDHYKKYGMGRWIIETKDQFIGWCGLKTNENGEIDLGFRILKEYWGQGYGIEAANSVLDYGFNTLKINKIIARTSIKNIKAQNLLSKIGMLQVGFSEEEKIGPIIKYYISKEQFN